jgi:microcystin-dependent protein
MPTQFTNIRGLPYPQGVDPVSVPAHIQALAVALDKVAVFDSGLRSARPITAMRRGDRFYATDEGIEYVYTGSAWATIGSAVGAPPIGAWMGWGTDADPPFVSGQGLWVLEDGRQLSETTYTALATLYGATGGGAGKYDTLHGAAAPSAGNFRIRDTRGVFLMGAENYGSAQAGVDRLPNTGATTGIRIGDVVGTERVTLDITQIPAHDHDLIGAVDNIGSTAPNPSPLGTYRNLLGPVAKTGQRGGGLPHTNIPPALASATIVRIA